MFYLRLEKGYEEIFETGPVTIIKKYRL